MYFYSILSFSLLTLLTFFLVIPSLYNALFFSNPLYALFLVVIFIGLIVGHFHEYQIGIVQQRKELKSKTFVINDLIVVTVTALATALTFFLNNEFQMGGVVASSLVGFTGPLLYPKQQRAIFCGSFAGMASLTVFTHMGWVLFAGLFAGFLLASSREIYDGFGGKLGACGFFGTIAASLLSGNFILLAEEATLTADFNIAFFFIAGAVATYYINKINHTGTVLASSFVGILAGLILPVMYGDPGTNYAVAAFCGSFVGMTVIDRLTSEFYLFLTSFIGAIIYFFSQANFIGLGGKLGTTAFSAIVAWWGLMQLRDMTIDASPRIRQRRKGNGNFRFWDRH